MAGVGSDSVGEGPPPSEEREEWEKMLAGWVADDVWCEEGGERHLCGE